MAGCVIRWYRLGDSVVPVYPGVEPLHQGDLVGLTIARTAELRLIRELLDVWVAESSDSRVYS